MLFGVLSWCRNQSCSSVTTLVVAAVSKGSAKEPVVMHLLRSMWFFVAHFDMSISIEHISRVCNGVADMLSRDKIQNFFLFESAVGSLSNTNPRRAHKDRVGVQTRLDLHNFQSAVQHYYQQGLAASTQKSYQSGQHRYLAFCSSIKKSPLPTTEDTLLMFVSARTLPCINKSVSLGNSQPTRFIRIARGVC